MSAVYGDVVWVVLAVVLVTFLLLARALRSLWLPVKALALNVVSHRRGLRRHRAGLAGGLRLRAALRQPATGVITTWVPIAAFSFLFGLSMDYEVFILARMREAYDDHGETDRAVVDGIGYTGRLVTSAALILFLAFIALSTVPSVEVKILATALALGIAHRRRDRARPARPGAGGGARAAQLDAAAAPGAAAAPEELSPGPTGSGRRSPRSPATVRSGCRSTPMTLTSGRYAAVTATLALIVALGGTSYAATQIGTAQLKANAVTSPKIKDGNVTGRDVRESSLANVPSATRATRAARATSAAAADRAAVADSAAEVNGVVPSKVIFYAADSVVDEVIFTGAGLTITASCDAPNFNLDLVATSSKEGSFLSAFGVADDNPSATRQLDFENNSLPVDFPVDLLLGDDGDVLQSTFTYSNPDGAVVTGDLASDVGQPTCSVRGKVLATPSR